ncbi:hypothetical protein [Ornithinimicrobium kibberense]|uniref:hypothetical protein n=1 Tax=Ornithinimicrobium kibberense TaxID=282060 RepID=UPI003A95764B
MARDVLQNPWSATSTLTSDVTGWWHTRQGGAGRTVVVRRSRSVQVLVTRPAHPRFRLGNGPPSVPGAQRNDRGRT